MAALAARTRTESRGQGVSSGAAGNGNGRGLDDHSADATPLHFGGGGLSSRFPSIVGDPWVVMTQTVGISGRVTGVSRYHFEATQLLGIVRQLAVTVGTCNIR